MKKIEDRLELWRKKHYQTLWKKMKTDLIPNVKGGKKQRKNKKGITGGIKCYQDRNVGSGRELF